MPVPSRERIEARLATLEAGGRAGAEASLRERAGATAFVSCQRCGGKGAYDEPGGKFVATCPGCSGLGRTRVTLRELARLQREAMKASRAAYARLRRVVCAARGFEAAAFDRIVRARIQGEPTAAKWLDAAATVASEFGLEAGG